MKWVFLSFLSFIHVSQTFAAPAEYQMLGIHHRPLKVVLPLGINDQGFAAQFYSIVQDINQSESAKEISILAWLGSESQFPLDGPEDATEISADDFLSQWTTRLRQARSLQPDAVIPGLEILRTRDPGHFSFIQDLFEIFAPQDGSPLLSLLNLGDSDGPDHLNPAIAENIKATVLDLPSRKQQVDEGGNLEVTPEGKPYVGSTTGSEFKSAIQNWTGQVPLELPTDWLHVGHVDEYVGFLPTDDECRHALIYADPLEAVNIIRKRRKVPLIPKEDMEGDGITYRDKEKMRKAILSSLKYLVLPKSVKKETLGIEDFDTARTPRSPFKIANFDAELLGNLHAYKEIQKGVSTLRQSLQCLKQVVGVPVLYHVNRGITGDPERTQEDITTGYTAITGHLNFVSLRNHVIIPKEREEFFGPIVRERLARVLGGAARVHEVDASYYEIGLGSVHCTTNVIRVPEAWH